MLVISTFLVISIIIPLVILIVIALLSARDTASRAKLSPFECGFDPINSSRLPFSLRFFLLSVIFIIFDVEIALLLPLPLSLNFPLLRTFLFLLILAIGLFHEWHEGSLEWTDWDVN